MTTVGVKLTEVVCPSCSSTVPVECADVTGMTFEDILADAMVKARSACPAHTTIPVGVVAAHGFHPYDLAAPKRPLIPNVSPLRHPPSEAEIAAAERKRSEQAARSYSDAAAEWNDLRAKAEGDPVAVAVLHLHQPRSGYTHAECDECKTDEDYEASPARWPCDTFEAVKTAITRPEATS